MKYNEFHIDPEEKLKCSMKLFLKYTLIIHIISFFFQNSNSDIFYHLEQYKIKTLKKKSVFILYFFC